MCSKCVDVTQQTQVECSNVTDLWYPLRLCYYRLPESPGYPLSVDVSSRNPTLNISVNTPTYEGGAVNLTEINDDDGDLMPSIMRMHIVRWDRVAEAKAAAGPSGNATSWLNTMTAQQCSFDLCAWSFSDWSYANGALKPGSTTKSMFLQPHITELDFGSPDFYILNTTDPEFPGNQTFTLSGNDYDGIFITLDDLWSRDTGGSSTDQLWNSLYEADRNISVTLDKMATGMTYSMMSGPNATLAQGQVFETETFIFVHWEWLSLAILTVVAAVAILVFTIVKTRAAHQRAWKSSLVPLLYADLTSMPPSEVGRDRWGEEHKAKRLESVRTGLLSPTTSGARGGLSS